MAATKEHKASRNMHAEKKAPKRRLARSGVIVFGTGVVAALAAILLSSTPGKGAFAVPLTCTPPLPQPGPARPWEAQVNVSTYSSVNTHNGNVFTAIPIVSWSGIGPDMNMMLYHNSAAVADTSFAQAVGFNLGPGWSLSYSDHLRLNELPNKVTMVAANGTKNVFLWSSYQQRWLPPCGIYDELTQDAENPWIWKLKHKDQSFHEFSTLVISNEDGIARLTRVVDATGNAALLGYDAVGVYPQLTPRLKSVLAGDRYLNFEFVDWAGLESRFLQTIRDPWDGDAGTHERKWTLHYDELSGGTGWLNEIEDAMQYEFGPGGGYRNVFTYDTAGRLKFVSDKCAGCSASFLPAEDRFTYSYDAAGRVQTITDPVKSGDPNSGLTQHFAAGCGPPPGVTGDPFSSRTYTDRRGSVWGYTHYEGGMPNAGTLSDIYGPVYGHYSFGSDRNLHAFWDGMLEVPWGAEINFWSATYDTRGNLLTLTDPLHHQKVWTYDAFNNATSYTDAAGNTVRYYYDLATYPTLLTRIVEPSSSGNPPLQNPGSEFPLTQLAYYLGTSTLDTNGFGQLKEVTDPNGVWTGFEYDQWGQQAKYIEGRWPSQVAVGGFNNGNWYANQSGSDGNGTGGSGSGGTGGGGSHDSNGNQTSSTCVLVATGSAAATGSWPPVGLPCNAPAIPGRSAEFFSATYSPKGELQVLPLNLGIGARTHSRSYDVMGRPRTVSVESSEAGGAPVTRTFTHAYDVANGRYTRTGPDGVDTYVELDGANRVQFVRLGPEGAPLMTATYTYKANGFVDRISYGNGTVVQYAYEGHRLAAIEHLVVPGTGQRLLRLDYEYDARDLPTGITEYGAGPAGTPAQALTTFTYDRRARLTRETRVYFPNPNDPTQNYDLEYQYDKGGNRTLKIDHFNDREVVYHYDVNPSNPGLYGSFNNRLMWYETFNTLPTPDESLSKTYYVYTYDSTYPGRAGLTDGNPTRIITEHVAESAASSVEGGRRGLRGGDRPAPSWLRTGFKVREAQDERAGDSSAGSTAAACAAGQTRYTSMRLGYARNGNAVTFAHDESWCWNQVQTCTGISNYTITWAREFRYDGARARYMNRKLSADLFTDLGTTWSDYDGDETYGDFTVTNGVPSNTGSYQPGLWRSVSGVSDYLHSDILGTLRQTTGTTGSAGASRVFTAFGERLPGSASDRLGYVGAWGYQSTPIPESLTPDPFPFLHVGARYYDPSSGRFLQRDPIGIRGGSNVYGYASAQPVTRIDPWGLWDWEKAGVGALCGAVTGSRFHGPIGTIVGAVAGLGGGYESGDAARAADKVREAIDDYVKRNVPKPPQPPGPPPSRPDAVFERPWDEKYPR